MALSITLYRSKFADTITKGDVIARDMRGSDQIEVLSMPSIVQNLVGGQTFVRIRARSLPSGEEGEMTYRPSNTVYVRVDPGRPNP